MDKAAFILDSYQFTKAMLDFEIPENSTDGPGMSFVSLNTTKIQDYFMIC